MADLSNLQKTFDTLVTQVQSALNLDIITYGVDINKPDLAADKDRRLAQSKLSPTGDIEQHLPVVILADGVKVDQDLYNVHLQAVAQAIQARKDMLAYVQELIKDLKNLL